MMRKVALVLVLGLVSTGGALAGEPGLSAGGGGMNVLDTRPDILWSEPPNLDGMIASSEIIQEIGLESEIANDFVLNADASAVAATWWGAYFNGNGCGDIGYGTTWNLRLYSDGGCVPTDLLSEAVAVPAHETLIYCQNGTFPVFEYYGQTDCIAAYGGVLYWFSAQAANHTYPPQVGRLASAEVVNCASVFRSAYFGFPEWAGAIDVFGVEVDFSQEFEVCIGTPVLETTWGAVKALYR
jgi:hypothetical protein